MSYVGSSSTSTKAPVTTGGPSGLRRVRLSFSTQPPATASSAVATPAHNLRRPGKQPIILANSFPGKSIFPGVLPRLLRLRLPTCNTEGEPRGIADGPLHSNRNDRAPVRGEPPSGWGVFTNPVTILSITLSGRSNPDCGLRVD